MRAEWRSRRDFIARYLAACQADDLAAEMGFYADPVDYMDEGSLRAAEIKAELVSYRRNWPGRHLKLIHCVASQVPSNANQMIVTYRYQFEVQGGGHERKGTEDIRATRELMGGDFEKLSPLRGL